MKPAMLLKGKIRRNILGILWKNRKSYSKEQKLRKLNLIKKL